MRYFRDHSGAVSGFDETVKSQLPYIQRAINSGATEITGSWPPAETQEQTQARLSATLTSAINDGAKEWGYDDIVSAVSYVTSTNPQYVAEAKALTKWRDDVWAWAIPALASATPGETAGQFLANMPLLPARPTV
jgi:hypothetical protein